MKQYGFQYLFLVGAIFLAGCGGKSEADKAATLDLKTLALAYQNFQSSGNRSPKNPEELMKLVQSDPPIQLDRYHIIWDADLNSIKEPRTVIAYEVGVPEKGGLVAFQDVTVERVTAEQFSKLKKATPVKP